MGGITFILGVFVGIALSAVISKFNEDPEDERDERGETKEDKLDYILDFYYDDINLINHKLDLLSDEVNALSDNITEETEDFDEWGDNPYAE